jgi:hypothetical protein
MVNSVTVGMKTFTTLLLSYAWWKKTEFWKGALRNSMRIKKSGKPFTLNRHAKERFENPEIIEHAPGFR